MMIRILVIFSFVLLPALVAHAQPEDRPSIDHEIQTFLSAHCVRCHGPKKQEGKVRLDRAGSADGELLRGVRGQLRDGLMPPEEEAQPSAALKRRFLEQLSVVIKSAGSNGKLTEDKLPNKGNLVPHELLFGKPAKSGNGASPARIWRLSPEAYRSMAGRASRSRDVSGNLVDPFALINERGIRDYAALYSTDQPTTEILVRNAATIVEAQCAGEMKDGKWRGLSGSQHEFVTMMDPGRTISDEDVVAAVAKQFSLVLRLKPTAEQTSRYLKLFENCTKDGDRREALKTVLQAVLLQTAANYRSESGDGEADASGRRRLSPRELAEALSLALNDDWVREFFDAADKGKLETTEQVEAILRDVLEKGDSSPRLLGFFRQYFDYASAPKVFKDRSFGLEERANDFEKMRGRFPSEVPEYLGSRHMPDNLVVDTEALIEHILKEDSDVLRKLLTTDRTFVNVRWDVDHKARTKTVTQSFKRNAWNDRGLEGPHYVYGFSEWPKNQPARIPHEKRRLGILMQPAWLVAHSTNFENDPVRRGRWIRERLLGQAVPDLPIGVAAQIPDEPHHTLRDRMEVTREQKCWKCHQWMDELGLPFEQFTHYGVYREAELVEDPEASRKESYKESPIKVFRSEKLNRTGEIANTGDPELDGPVKDAYELVHRLADSERVRQVFVRHVFRYFFGRNETVEDAATLQKADRDYVESDGSFKTLVVSLLTSDAFLYRRQE